MERAAHRQGAQRCWRFLRAHKIELSGRESWCQSTTPNLRPRPPISSGFYMAPPENAIVLAVDEKQSIQTLERAQGYLKLPNGRAMTGQSHDYKRHGTTTLFAALNIATGEVVGRHYKRRRRVEFLFHEPGRRRLSRARNPRRPQQSLYPQTQARHVAKAA